MTAPAYAPSPLPAPAPPILALVPPVAGITGTPQQEAFWRAVEDGKMNLCLDALAGTGKSFSICHAAKRVLQKYPKLLIGFCAFNRSIADELKRKIPAGCESDTFHSYGLRAISDHLGRKPDIQNGNGGKNNIILKAMLSPDELDARKRVPKALLNAVGDIVSMCKSYLLTGTPDDIRFITERHDIELSPNRAKAAKGLTPSSAAICADAAFKSRVYELVPRVLERAKEMVSTIDIDDMLWLPIVLNLPTIPVFHLLFIDESQDLNAVRMEFAFRMCHSKGRIVCVGDVNQAIYAFTGADCQAMATMAARMEATPRGFARMPLTVSFRCPKAAAREAQAIVPSFEVLPDAIEGSVEHVSEKDAPALMQPGDMVLCRCKAPLVKMAHHLLRGRKKALLRGIDLSKPVLELMGILGETDVKAMGDALKSYRATEVDRLHDANKSVQVIANFEDLCETLEVLMEGCSNRSQIETKIDQIFNQQDPEGSVLLMTAHGSKGLEADTVWLLNPELFPHPVAIKRAQETGDESQLEQERNLEYVAKTRTKDRLVYIDSKEKPKEATPAVEAKPAEMPAPALCATVVAPVAIVPKLDTDSDAVQILSANDRARAGLQAAFEAARHDWPHEFYQAIEAALRAIPR